MAERIVVAVVALVLAAGSAVALTAARAEDRLFGLQFVDRPDLGEASDLERAASRLTPGERGSLLLSSVRLRGGDGAGALAVARAAARREPENAEAWLAVSRAAREADPALARRALQRLRELVPAVPAP